MPGRFTLAGLLMAVALVALVLAIVVPTVRYSRRMETHADSVTSVAASADGSTFAALMGDGRVFFWDKRGSPTGSLETRASFDADLALSFDGKLMSVSPNEILEVNTGSVWCTLPTSVTDIAFSPTEDRFAAINDTWAGRPMKSTGKQRSGSLRYEVCMLDGNGGATTVSVGRAACLSPDGKRLAVVKNDHEKSGGVHIEIYDLASGRVESSRAGRLPTCTGLQWASDGQSVAAVFTSCDSDNISYTVAKLGLSGGISRSAPVQSGDKTLPLRRWYALAYLPDGRGLLLGATLCGFTPLNADTLETITAADMSKLCHVAAGVRGDAFIAAESHAVDLWDATTLRPRQRLFEAARPPDPRLPICGLLIWGAIFVVRCRRKAVQSPNSCSALASGKSGGRG